MKFVCQTIALYSPKLKCKFFLNALSDDPSHFDQREKSHLLLLVNINCQNNLSSLGKKKYALP